LVFPPPVFLGGLFFPQPHRSYFLFQSVSLERVRGGRPPCRKELCAEVSPRSRTSPLPLVRPLSPTRAALSSFPHILSFFFCSLPRATITSISRHCRSRRSGRWLLLIVSDSRLVFLRYYNFRSEHSETYSTPCSICTPPAPPTLRRTSVSDSLSHSLLFLFDPSRDQKGQFFKPLHHVFGSPPFSPVYNGACAFP